ncbi:MAG: hypothetical protein LBS81_01080 [Endomicrobium sp.]|jgi:hypothetical protein|nr:hypothetical protein [Endomicrobium sp.]
MSLYDIKRVQISSILKIFPVVFLILGIVLGSILFFVSPTGLVAGLGFDVKLLSWFLFVVSYTVIMVIGIVFVAWSYNFVASKLTGGVVISIEPKE